MNVTVGTLVTATKHTTICEVGERGVCYEEYRLHERPGHSFIFARGGYCGFSPDEVDYFLTVHPHICLDVADYVFLNVMRLMSDYQSGRFNAAFETVLETTEGNTTTIDMGTRVICDSCDQDWTHRTESGGFYGFGSKAICPDCTPAWEENAKKHDELGFIKARCPSGKSFADWVREDLR